MGELRKYQSRWLWVQWRFKNPYRNKKRVTPEDGERCQDVTAAGTQCLNGARDQYCYGHEKTISGLCGIHFRMRHGRHRAPAKPVSDEGLPADPAEWLESLGRS